MSEVDHFLQGLYEQKSKVVDLKARRKAIKEALGSFSSNNCEVKCVKTIQHQGYLEAEYLLATTGPLYLPFRLLTPNYVNNGSEVVLALHGHGRGANEALNKNSIHRGFALSFVERGMTVVLPELVGFGQRTKSNEKKENSCFSLAAQLLLYKQTLAGLRVFECKRLVDWLTREGYTQIGCMGFSGGGWIASLLTAIDERIKATVLSGFGSFFKDSIISSDHCLDNYVPGFMKIGEMTDLLELIVPRPLLIEAGEEDHLFPFQSIQDVIRKNEQVILSPFVGGHMVSGHQSIPWLIQEVRKER
ncbi:alpha/beta hydrolase family protein [Alkalihalobacillus pseudalcaliphilus]|uniref:alpha/beta hydrolase family protein n=1 Tax=Alkalihalobacillus pseudalcaliphilus TaxID=79884 RepID=UPI00064DDEEA|nr:alpha/beta hydrolase family protein [Alkalihalobacillus pseudalcaliphilus]KMK74396.1 hypothetical protein AB990_21015 [Alkalihalobacillus pseudalcaliphilus]